MPDVRQLNLYSWLMTKRRFQRVTRTKPGVQPLPVSGSDSHHSDVVSICKLCGVEGSLRLGHVLPKWVYRWAKAEGGVVGFYKSLGVETFEQDGVKQYLLCEGCEQFLGAGERYASILMCEEPAQWKAAGITERYPLIYGTNPLLLRRFIYGAVLKSHWCDSPPFHKVRLEVGDELLLKTHLRDGIVDENRFPLVAMRFISRRVPGIDPKAMIFAMWLPEQEPAPAFSLLAAGWEWLLFFNHKGRSSGSMFDRVSATSDGSLWAGRSDICDHRLIQGGHVRGRERTG